VKLNNMAQTSAHLRHQMVVITFILVLASAWFTEVIGMKEGADGENRKKERKKRRGQAEVSKESSKLKFFAVRGL
jgi:hypothetical protein